MAHLKNHSEQGTLVVEFFDTSILNQSEIESIGQELYSIASKSACSQIIVDLKEIHFMSSAMIGVFIQFKMKLRKNDSELKLCNVKPELLKMLKLTKLDKVFDIYPTRRDALHAFRSFAG